MFFSVLIPWAKKRAVALSGVLLFLGLGVLLWFLFRNPSPNLIYDNIPIPFASAAGTDFLAGKVAYFGKRGGVDIFEVTFNDGEVSERFLPDRIYLVHIPNNPSIRDVPLDIAMRPIAGTDTAVDYYGYKYSDAAATQERRDIKAFRFKDRFSGHFFASDKARLNDITAHNALAAFEQANDVAFLRTDQTTSSVHLDPSGSLYVFVINETNGSNLLPRRETWCGDHIVQVDTEQCDDGNSVDNDLCHNDCTMGVPIPFGDPNGSNTGAKLAVSVRNISTPHTASPGENSITLMKFDVSANNEPVILTNLVFRAMTGSVDSLTNYRIWEDSNADGFVDRPAGRLTVPSSGQVTFSSPSGWTGSVIGSGKTILYELRADVPQSITDPGIQVVFATGAVSYVGGQRINGTFPLVGIETDGVCSIGRDCPILVTTHLGIPWYFPVCGNGRAELGEECNEPGLSCGANQSCVTNICVCQAAPPTSSANSSSASQNSSAGGSANSSVESSAQSSVGSSASVESSAQSSVESSTQSSVGSSASVESSAQSSVESSAQSSVGSSASVESSAQSSVESSAESSVASSEANSSAGSSVQSSAGTLCGNGVLDPGAGEECEPTLSPPGECDADCHLVTPIPQI